MLNFLMFAVRKTGVGNPNSIQYSNMSSRQRSNVGHARRDYSQPAARQFPIQNILEKHRKQPLSRKICEEIETVLEICKRKRKKGKEKF